MPTQKLTLTTTSLHNVVISNHSDVIYYEVVTPKWGRGTTRVSRLDPNARAFDVVGELRNEDDRPVAVRVYGGEFRPVDEFLQSAGEEAKTGRFRGKDGRAYVWVIKDRHLELVREAAPDEKPLAVFHRHKRWLFVLRMSRHPYIEIDPSVLDTLDSLIISFLLMERRRRHREK
ncbi:hypothetical protein BV25DRAFT_689489 [Artomyces pyxidatus]|uniref:Uncharacterized protein n=1 Tax=Artomyces pyxidatus TaxID=48021 RepID=A0ACB8SZN9_9AGAM|nr:hypothetical protein BV25DRAFT_689489 [Artomyces pyxidatus]